MSVDVGQLANYGIVGVVLAWFMLRADKRDEQLQKDIENNTLVLKEVCVKLDAHKE